MFSSKCEKVESTSFSEFIRHASSCDKKKFFDKVVKKNIEKQQPMIEKAKETCCC